MTNLPARISSMLMERDDLKIELAAVRLENRSLREALEAVRPFIPLGYAATSRPGGSDERNMALAEARSKMALALDGRP